MDMKKQMAAGAFKQGCLAVLDEVDERGIEVVITKRNRPVARLVPIVASADREKAILSRLRGRGRMLVGEDEFVEPIGDAGWPDLASEP